MPFAQSVTRYTDLGHSKSKRTTKPHRWFKSHSNLAEWWILPIGGVALERVCVYSLCSRLVFAIAKIRRTDHDHHTPLVLLVLLLFGRIKRWHEALWRYGHYGHYGHYGTYWHNEHYKHNCLDDHGWCCFGPCFILNLHVVSFFSSRFYKVCILHFLS